MATAIQPKPDRATVIHPHTEREWTVGRSLSLAGLGAIPVAAVALQANNAGIMAAIAAELLLVGVMLKKWHPVGE